MSSTTSTAYDTKSWSHHDQSSTPGMTASSSNYDQDPWHGQMLDTMPNSTYYSPSLYAHSDVQMYRHQGATFGSSALHPASSLSPSTAHETFSSSEYASDAPALADAISDYGTPSFDHSFSDFNSSQMINTITTSSLLSSQGPAATHSQAVSLDLGAEAPGLITDTSAIASEHAQQQQQTMHSTAQNLRAKVAPLPLQPQLVVTIDEYEDGLVHDSEPRQHIRRRNSSKAHLSPYPDDELFDEEENGHQPTPEALEPTQNQPVGAHSIAHNGHRAGLAPSDRAILNSNEIPSLDELEKQQRLDERNAEVEDWLSNNELGSSEELSPQALPSRSKVKPRPRAKSTNDSPHSSYGGYLYHGLHSLPAVPGPGLTINVPSEMDDDEDYEDDSEPDSPPASVNPFESEAYFSLPGQFDAIQYFSSSRDETNMSSDPLEKAVAGITANIAIMRFRQRAKDIDSASVTATLGSRRMSESDVGSIRGATGISKLLLSPQQSERIPVRRKNSFLENFLPSRNNSNKLKRKSSHPVEQAENASSGSACSPKDGQGPFAAPKRIGSFGRPKTPKVDTSVSSPANDARSPKAVASAASGAIKQIWRSRSRSDLGRSPKMGLAELMTQHGGPPMPTLASPLQHRAEPAPQVAPPADYDSENEDTGASADGLTMNLSVRTDMHIIPTYDGFKYNARQLNPRLADFLLDRIAQEQVKRYERLVSLKTNHAQSVALGVCSSKAFCLLSGGQSQDLPPRPGNKESENNLVSFQIVRPGMTDDDLGAGNVGQNVVAAQFPTGVLLPPVNRLPAEFECPLCFQVKKFYKPSDWTKHVHEDVQPFTCTFRQCNEPKSFKRKADWVRHENERHRQLEYWVCSVQECNHTCYRKDNFVQHLVREHKVPEPKVRTGRAGGQKGHLENAQNWQSQSALSGDGVEDVWALVDKCHRDSSKQPKDEPCKFCGNICTSWKKLTVHLAKHMEQISMPILPLVGYKKTTVEHARKQAQNIRQPVSVSTKPLDELPTFLCDEPMSLETEPQSVLSVDNCLISPAMHSYPPITMNIQAQMATTQAELATGSLSMVGNSYPPPSIQSRSRASSYNEPDFMRPGATCSPGSAQDRNLVSAGPTQYDSNGNRQMYFPQASGIFMQEPLAATNVYLTPTSNTPASLGYSPEGSTHSLHQTYGLTG
ncbi:uncharacterized protein PV09_08801 [Verruconis gallopava]|uniref:C2H2-type domain-containing protein n=1 Tax=Verruconis gallopava TaxID=253628 RepID=A0A0D1XBA6_9PEZI|nr:uncharacterized protein PV09_08801 [Verruconis gallopava]KIV99495.1 hypothetical protein PV09_08801 [Verruconis gallopava]